MINLFQIRTICFGKDKIKLISHGIIQSLTHHVIPLVRSSTTTAEAWDCLKKLYANASSSRTMGLTEQLTLIGRGSKSVANSLAEIRGIANESALIGESVKETNLIIHTLKGVGPEFKEIAVAVCAHNTIISFEKLHDKLSSQSFLKCDESCTSGVLPLTGNNTRLSQPKNGNQYQQGKKGNYQNQNQRYQDLHNNNQSNTYQTHVLYHL